MTVLVFATAAGTGVGLWLLLIALLPQPPRLTAALAALQPPPPPPAVTMPPDDAGWSVRLGRPIATHLTRLGLPTAATRRELAAVNRSVDTHVAEQTTATIAGLLLPTLLAALLTLGGLDIPLTLPAIASIATAAAGFAIPEIAVRIEATQQRNTFRHALGIFLDLVVVGLAAGAGVDQALHDAGKAGTGPAFADLRHALHQAHLSSTPPWDTLAALGRRIGVDELQHLAAAIGLAGTEGAAVRASLHSRAAALRTRQLTATEATAASATERMSLPIVLLFGAFLLVIGYPAVAAVLGGF